VLPNHKKGSGTNIAKEGGINPDIPVYIPNMGVMDVNSARFYLAAGLYLVVTLLKLTVPAFAAELKESILPVMREDVDYVAAVTDLGSLLTDNEMVQAVMQYPEKKHPAAFVSTQGMTHMAQLNACRVMLEAWPVTDEESACALCEAMMIADGAQRPEELFMQINLDRDSAGMPQATDMSSVADRLDAVRRKTAQRLYERISALPEQIALRIFDKTALMYKQRRSPIAEALVHVYEIQIHGNAVSLAEQMDAILRELEGNGVFSREKKAKELYVLLDKWGKLMLPVRRLQSAKGYQAKDSLHVYETVVEAGCILNNKIGLIEPSYRLTCLMQEVFFNLPDAQILLAKNRKIQENALGKNR